MAKTLTVEAFVIEGAAGLDPVAVFWQDVEPGKGHVTIHCYGEAWTAWWGAMGDRSIKQFFAHADDGYIVNRLTGAQFQKHTKGHEQYLTRIVRAIKDDLKAVAA